MVRRHILVSGGVQGVGFRYFVRQTALRLALTGWVRNLDDGDVELEAQGTPENLRLFIAQVRTGPRFARVRGVRIRDVPPKDEQGFEILYE